MTGTDLFRKITLDVALGDLSKRSRSKDEIFWTQHHSVPAQYLRCLCGLQSGGMEGKLGQA